MTTISVGRKSYIKEGMGNLLWNSFKYKITTNLKLHHPNYLHLMQLFAFLTCKCR
jgi:hypothetical protein